MARFLVTGGVGFIGYHVTRALLARGDDVVVADDFSDRPYPREEKLRNEADLRAEFPRVRVVRACVTDRAAMAPLVGDAEAVLHLAGLAGVRPSFGDPVRYARVNVEGTAVVQELARQQGLERFLFASSSSVYGNATPLPAAEEAPAVVPESPYAASKRGAELVASSICRNAPAMRCTALRFFTVYGPRQRPEMAIHKFTELLAQGKTIPMFGDGESRRDYTYVDDIVDGLVATLALGPGFEILNLGGAETTSLKDLIHWIAEELAVSPRIEYLPTQPGDVPITYADVSKAARLLGYSPKVPIREGLRRFVAWYQENR